MSDEIRVGDWVTLLPEKRVAYKVDRVATHAIHFEYGGAAAPISCIRVTVRDSKPRRRLKLSEGLEWLRSPGVSRDMYSLVPHLGGWAVVNGTDQIGGGDTPILAIIDARRRLRVKP